MKITQFPQVEICHGVHDLTGYGIEFEAKDAKTIWENFEEMITFYLYENSDITETQLKLKRNRMEWEVNNDPQAFIDRLNLLYKRNDFKLLYRRIEEYLEATVYEMPEYSLWKDSFNSLI